MKKFISICLFVALIIVPFQTIGDDTVTLTDLFQTINSGPATPTDLPGIPTVEEKPYTEPGTPHTEGPSSPVEETTHGPGYPYGEESGTSTEGPGSPTEEQGTQSDGPGTQSERPSSPGKKTSPQGPSSPREEYHTGEDEPVSVGPGSPTGGTEDRPTTQGPHTPFEQTEDEDDFSDELSVEDEPEKENIKTISSQDEIVETSSPGSNQIKHSTSYKIQLFDKDLNPISIEIDSDLIGDYGALIWVKELECFISVKKK